MTTMASLPSNSSTLTDATAELNDKALDGKIDLHSEAIHDKFTEVVQSKAVQDTTVRAIEDLNITLQSIKQAFRKVREDLQRFDNEGYLGENGVVMQLSPEWDKLQGVRRPMPIAARLHADHIFQRIQHCSISMRF